MWNWIMFAYIAVLFFLLTPNILLRLPPNGSKTMVAIVHALVFAAVLCYTKEFVWNMSMTM
jgi:hypothetical protein